jgi:hypothetical protein
MGDQSKPRILTESEARVVWKILSGGLETEEDRMRDSGIPRTTYREAKHRLYSEGLLEDRFVPNPDAIGIPRVTFYLSRPAAEEANSVLDQLSKLPGTVEAWAGTQVVFSVVFHDSVGSSELLLKRINEGKLGNPRAVVSVDTGKTMASESQVPVYFDFEGAWVRFCGLSATRRYPCPLPPPHPATSARDDATKQVSPSVASLLTRHFTRPSHLMGPSSIPRSQRKSLQLGKVEWRVFLDFSRLRMLEYRGLSFHDLIFVTGTMRKPNGLAELLPDLLAGCNVRPLLLAGDDASVLMIGLGIGLGATRYAPPDLQPSRSVVQTMAHHAKDIDVIREPLISFRTPVAHRYDLLVQS